MFIDRIQKVLDKSLSELYPHLDLKPKLEYPSSQTYGDLTTNIALSLGSKLNQSPREIASEIVEKINQDKLITDNIENISIEGPGFINFYLKDSSLWESALIHLLSKSTHQNNPGKGKKVIVEFSSPNIAKPFNVGHLRSTIIGDSIARLYEYLGYQVIRDNHLGDWGTQYGKLAYAVDNWGDWEKIEKNPIRELFDLYVRFHREEGENPQLSEAGREYFKKLEHKDPRVLKTWEKLVDLSIEDFNKLYERLGVRFDIQLGESYYEPMLAGVIEECKSKGIARESNGALLIFFDDVPELKEYPLMIVKSNGTSTYGTRDLAGVKYRFNKYKIDKLIIEIGNEQQLYFKQIIKASEMMGWVDPGQLVHIGHGLFMLPTGKMSTRKGETVWVSELIDELEIRARSILSERKDLYHDEIEAIVNDVAIGALKYNDLSQNRLGNVVFDKEKSLALDGNSAPYLQYTIARSASVLRKYGLEVSSTVNIDKIKDVANNRQDMLEESEREILALLTRFDKIVEQSAETYLPSTLASYLFSVAQKYNSFYQSNSILNSDSPIKESRILIVHITQHVLSKGLELLGINSPSRM